MRSAPSAIARPGRRRRIRVATDASSRGPGAGRAGSGCSVWWASAAMSVAFPSSFRARRPGPDPFRPTPATSGVDGSCRARSVPPAPVPKRNVFTRGGSFVRSFVGRRCAGGPGLVGEAFLVRSRRRPPEGFPTCREAVARTSATRVRRPLRGCLARQTGALPPAPPPGASGRSVVRRRWFSSRTVVSLPPTIRSVAAVTAGRTSMARSNACPAARGHARRGPSSDAAACRRAGPAPSSRAAGHAGRPAGEPGGGGPGRRRGEQRDARKPGPGPADSASSSRSTRNVASLAPRSEPATALLRRLQPAAPAAVCEHHQPRASAARRAVLEGHRCPPSASRSVHGPHSSRPSWPSTGPRSRAVHAVPAPPCRCRRGRMARSMPDCANPCPARRNQDAPRRRRTAQRDGR